MVPLIKEKNLPEDAVALRRESVLINYRAVRVFLVVVGGVGIGDE